MFVKTAKKAQPACAPEKSQSLGSKALASIQKSMANAKAKYPALAAEIESAPGALPGGILVGVDMAAGSAMSTLAVCKPIPSGGEPGQVLAIGGTGDPEWITLDLQALPEPSKNISIEDALQALVANGLYLKQVDINSHYSYGNYPEIELVMNVSPPPEKQQAVMSALHGWYYKKTIGKKF